MINVRKHLNKNEEIKNISIVTMILYPLILLLANEMNITSYIIYTIVGFVLILGIVVTAIEDTKSFLIMIALFFAVVIINYIFHLDTFNESINIIIKNFIMCYLMFIIAVNIKDKDKFFNSLKIGRIYCNNISFNIHNYDEKQ